MIHSIKFKDISEEIEKAKAEAKRLDAEEDAEYERELVEHERRIKACDTAEPSGEHPWRRRQSMYEPPQKRTRDTDWREIVDAHYVNALDALNGREFRFSGGLNIIVGENGSGKTSLLDVMRGLMLCGNSEMQSGLWGQYWAHRIERDSIPFFGFCEMRADYRRCLFNLVKDEDLNTRDGFNNIMQFVQFYEGGKASKGEKIIIALNTLLKAFAESGAKPIEDADCDRGMEKCALKALRDYLANFSRLDEDDKGDEDDGFNISSSLKDFKNIFKYYDANQMNDSRFTILIDEPDAGLDVFKAKIVCDFLERMADDAEKNIIQPIVVLHNVAIIKRLLKHPNVNVIELTPGYINAIKDF